MFASLRSSDVYAAAERIRGIARRTTLRHSPALSAIAQTEVNSYGDVNALELGIAAARIPLGQPIANLRAAYVKDFAHDARRVKIAASLDPGFSGPLGPLCGLGSYEPFPGQERIYARCLFVLEAEGIDREQLGSSVGRALAMLH